MPFRLKSHVKPVSQILLYNASLFSIAGVANASIGVYHEEHILIVFLRIAKSFWLTSKAARFSVVVTLLSPQGPTPF